VAEHYTSNTIECTAWCEHCRRNTRHAVSANRRGRCLEHDAPKYSKKQLARRAKLAKQGQQPSLF
jgi:hypothetical protein